ncbi:shikimate dehydrogenase [Candidatus Poribacteria bacterium]|nr:shikimate dehydrogenase [Candidatus Poribacteria bacterium]
MDITGHTKIVGVIGDPVEHSRSPQMQNAAFREMGLDYIYVPFHVLPENLAEAVEGFKATKVRGINVTLPHKKNMLPLMDSISREAELIGAVNTLVFDDGQVSGHNTDARGFVASLQEEGIEELKGKNVVVLGAGGAARAVVVGLALQAVDEIIIANRTTEKAVQLAKDMSSGTGVSMKGISIKDPNLPEYMAKSDLLVSTITAGMDPSIPLVIDEEWFHDDLVVCDIVYTPPETNLLKAAAKRGLKTVGGMGMLVHQGAISFELWTSKYPPVKTMRKALEDALKRR